MIFIFFCWKVIIFILLKIYSKRRKAVQRKSKFCILLKMMTEWLTPKPISLGCAYVGNPRSVCIGYLWLQCIYKHITQHKYISVSTTSKLLCKVTICNILFWSVISKIFTQGNLTREAHKFSFEMLLCHVFSFSLQIPLDHTFRIIPDSYTFVPLIIQWLTMTLATSIPWVFYLFSSQITQFLIFKDNVKARFNWIISWLFSIIFIFHDFPWLSMTFKASLLFPLAFKA